MFPSPASYFLVFLAFYKGDDMELCNSTILLKLTPFETEAITIQDFPVSLRPKGVQFLDWRLLQLMYDKFFKHNKPCFMKAERLAYILSGGTSTAASIRNSRCRLKKAGLITVQNAKSDFSNKTVAYCFITEKGENLMKSFFANKDKSAECSESPVSSDLQAIKTKDDKKYSLFDYRISRRYSKRIQKSYPMKSKNEWNESWAEVLRKLREIDNFTEKEIEDTIDFIISDNKPRNGFCFAKVLRSPLQFRSKWKNGMTKFCTAYEEMKAHKLSNPDIEDEESLPFALREINDNGRKIQRKVFDPPRNLTSDNPIDLKISQAYEDLMSLPHPQWKLNSDNFLQYEQFCFDLSLLFEEFILDRGWDKQIIDQFFEVQRVDNKNLKFYTTDILREKVEVFFKKRVPKYFPLSIGKFNQLQEHYLEHRPVVVYYPDETYMSRIDDFLADQRELCPFENATTVYDDDEVELDYEWKKYKKGEFNK